MSEKLFDLVVTIVSDDGTATPSAQRYQLLGRNIEETWESPLYSEDEYRRAMSGTGLTAGQIESPINTGSRTTFGGVGGGDLMFTEQVIQRMGLRQVKR